MAAGPVPVKQDGYYGAPGPQSPVSPYSNGGQQWQQQQQPQQLQAGTGQPVYNNVPSPSMSPAPQQMAAPYVADARPFSSELEATHVQGHGAPEVVSVQPKR